ncbi:MAG: fibronectin type III domain-containing protein [Patescibacteria group bacterium]
MKKFVFIVLSLFFSVAFIQHPVKAAECVMASPVGAPTIFKVDRNSTGAVLHITPAGVPYTEYVVAYGFNEGDERFGATFPQSSTDTEITHKISGLDPGSTYYFRVRAGNDCQPGQWSAWYSSKGSAVLAAETGTDATASSGTEAVTALPEAGSPHYLLMLGFAVPLLFILAGVLL